MLILLFLRAPSHGKEIRLAPGSLKTLLNQASLQEYLCISEHFQVFVTIHHLKSTLSQAGQSFKL